MQSPLLSLPSYAEIILLMFAEKDILTCSAMPLELVPLAGWAGMYLNFYHSLQ